MALGVPVLALLIAESIIIRSWLSAGFAAYVGILLGVTACVRIAAARTRGRATRNRQAQIVRSPSRWPELDRALVAYSIRTGCDAPIVVVSGQRNDGTPVTRVDASLNYMGAPDPETGVRPLRSPLEAQSGDLLVVGFDEPMLNTYDADELLAVILHLVERAALWRQATVRVSNGACEADSRTLLITHDHVALLRALEKCTRPHSTFPPGYGLVSFSDLDVRARRRAGLRESEWEARDRLVELRRHLMAAALDVQPGSQR